MLRIPIEAISAGIASLPGVSAEFLLTSLVMVLILGTGVVYTVSSSIGGGRRRGLFAALGCTLGIVPYMLAAMLGLSGIMQAGSLAFEVVRWAGVAYLIYMGVAMIREGSALQVEGQDVQHGSTGSMGLVVWRAVLLNLLNPTLTTFFFAFLPQFLDAPPALLDPRLLWLGGTFMLMTLAVFVLYGWASAAARELVLGTPVILR